MTMKISFSEVRAAQQVVADGIEEMSTLTRSILAQSGATQSAMQAPAGQVAAQTFDDLGGGGKALAESLAQLHKDLTTLQRTAVEGSESATRIARSATAGNGSITTTVASGM